MKALKISEHKNFMSKLLLSDCFDVFLLAEASITTYNTFFIDGHMIQAFYDNKEDNTDYPVPEFEYSCWTEMKNIIYDLIRGKRTPVAFHIVLYLMPELMEEILTAENIHLTEKDVKAFVLNIKYQDGAITLVTATSMNQFYPDKTPDQLWDLYLIQYLNSKDIVFEEI